MAQAPVMPLFTDALIGDTTHLSAEQFGAYMLILIATWRNNGKPLPDDDARMSRICRISLRKWRQKVRITLTEMFDINESGWHQQRLEKEWNRVKKWQEKLDNSSQNESPTRAGGSARARLNHKPYRESSSSTEESPRARLRPARAIARAAPRQAEPEARAETTWRPLAAVLGMPTPPAPELTEENKRAARVQEHMEFLRDHVGSAELGSYLEAALSDDPEVAQRAFDAVEAMMTTREGMAA